MVRERVGELTAAVIARWLQAVASGAVDATTSQRVTPGSAVVVMGGQWEIMLLIDWDRRPAMTDRARCGDQEWWRGCERDWEALGPPVEPLELLLPAEVEQLMAALEMLPMQESEGECPYWDFEAVARRQAAVAAGKRRKRSRVKG